MSDHVESKPEDWVRLACGECDLERYDGITPEKLAELSSEGWTGIVPIQTYEDSVKIYDHDEDAPAGYSPRDWYTHIGTCPDCQESTEKD